VLGPCSVCVRRQFENSPTTKVLARRTAALFSRTVEIAKCVKDDAKGVCSIAAPLESMKYALLPMIPDGPQFEHCAHTRRGSAAECGSVEIASGIEDQERIGILPIRTTLKTTEYSFRPSTARHSNTNWKECNFGLPYLLSRQCGLVDLVPFRNIPALVLELV